MTILKDNQVEAPPPPYAAIPSISTESSSSAEHPNALYTNSGLMPGPSGQQVQHPSYGPTPITSQEQSLVLPYYDPRSPYAMQQAIARARWRFFNAFLCAVGIWATVGIVTGSIVVDVRRGG